MRIIRAAKDLVRALEAEQRDGNICLHERHTAGILEQPYYRRVRRNFAPDEPRVPDAALVSRKADHVFETDWHARERAV
jgi:hypothetical protein